MTVTDTATLLLFALVAVVGGVVSFLLVRRHRRRAGAWQGGWARWATPPSIDPSPADGEADEAAALFQPTRVMSYAEAVREGWFEQPASPADGPAGAVDGVAGAQTATGQGIVGGGPAAGGQPDHAERPLLRLKLVAGDGSPPRFATMRVLQLSAADGERTMLVRVEGAEQVERIPVGCIEAAIDVAGRARVDDPWRWLQDRLGIAVQAVGVPPAGEADERSNGLGWPNGAVWPGAARPAERPVMPLRPDRDSIDTATQPA